MVMGNAMQAMMASEEILARKNRVLEPQRIKEGFDSAGTDRF